jgi:hypothetical protein
MRRATAVQVTFRDMCETVSARLVESDRERTPRLGERTVAREAIGDKDNAVLTERYLDRLYCDPPSSGGWPWCETALRCC